MAIEFPFAPNWSRTVSTEETFATEIITSRNRTEQRRALILNPRRTLSFQVLETKDQARRLRAFVERYIQAEFEIADPLRSTTIANPSAVAAEFVELQSAPSWIAPGAALFVDDADYRERIVVASVVGTTVNLGSGLLGSLREGATVSPILAGRLDQNASNNLSTSNTASGDVTLNVDPDGASLPAGSATATFNGRELFLIRPNWASAPSIATTGFLETADMGYGVKTHTSYLNWNGKTVQMSYLGRDRSEVEITQGFFRRMKGRRGDFYMPTWENDIPLINAAVGASIIVPGTEFFELYGQADTFTAAIALYKDGSYQANLLQAIAEDGSDTTLTFTEAWAAPTNGNTVASMSWLPLYRLGSDTLALEWLTNAVAQWKLSFQILKEWAA